MKKILVIVFSVFLFNNLLIAQREKPIIVKAGHDVKNYFPKDVRYRYPEFLPGKAVFRNGIFSEARFNYNLLNDDMEFIKSRDTLSIINKKEITYIVVAADTFLYDNGFIEIISDGVIKVGIKKHFNLNAVEKKDSYGTSSAGSARESYNSMPADGNYYKLKASADMVFQKTTEYYLAKDYRDFVPYRKNYVTKMFPEKADEIKKYLKTYKIDFDSEQDLMKFTEFLRNI